MNAFEKFNIIKYYTIINNSKVRIYFTIYYICIDICLYKVLIYLWVIEFLQNQCKKSKKKYKDIQKYQLMFLY